MILLQANAFKIPLKDKSVEMIITSPPYFNAKEYSQWETYEDYLADMQKAWSECYRILIDGGRIAVNVPLGYGRPGKNGGYRRIGDHIAAQLEAVGFVPRGIIIWYKQELTSESTSWGSWMSATDPCLRDAYEIIIVMHKGNKKREKGINTIGRDEFMAWTVAHWDIPPKSSSWHPAPFPEELPRRLIELYTFKDDIVIDPFAGSFTTIKVARNLGRIGIGLDYTWDYVYRASLESKYSEKAATEIVKGQPPLFAEQPTQLELQ